MDSTLARLWGSEENVSVSNANETISSDFLRLHSSTHSAVPDRGTGIRPCLPKRKPPTDHAHDADPLVV
ncbi:MAG: hypothetical protein V3V08_10940 [Nannocystaceae bacterium]